MSLRSPWLRRTSALIATAVTLVTTLAACGSNETENPNGPLTINVGVQSAVLQTNYPQLAQALGYFKDENLQVNLTVGDNTAQAIQGLIGGSINLYIGGPEGLTANEQGADIRFIAAAANRSIFNVVTTSDVTDLRQLNNANIGVSAVQSISTVTTKQALETQGVDTKNLKYIVAGGTAKRFSAVQAGQVKAAPMGIPVNYQAVQEGLKDFGNTNSLGAPPIITGLVNVNKPWADSHRETLRRFLRAYQRTVDALYDPAMKEQNSKILADVLKIDKPYVDRALDEIFLQGDGSMMPKDSHIDPKALQTAADALLSYGALKQAMDPAKFIDNSYLEDAQKSLAAKPPASTPN